MIVLFAKLLIAHLVGDFILLRNKRLKEKGKKLWKSRTLVVHSLIHFILAFIAFWDITYWMFALAIGLSHYVSELLLRGWLSRRPQIAFASGQIFHLLLLYLICGGYLICPAISWVTVAGLLAVTFPSAKFIEVFLSQWPPAKSVDRIKGLKNAGLWIGILERILIYIFIVTNHWEGIGFLLAAKSIFRFGDLTNSKDIYLTEYIMVGTLLSFSLAIVTGLSINYFLP
jgi:hypothetical protein